jgi:hypothetical protein
MVDCFCDEEVKEGFLFGEQLFGFEYSKDPL